MEPLKTKETGDLIISLDSPFEETISNEYVRMWHKLLTEESLDDIRAKIEDIKAKIEKGEKDKPLLKPPLCSHAHYYLFVKKDLHYLWARDQALWGTATYRVRVCMDCNQVMLREKHKDYNPWKHCHKCGGTMHYLRSEQALGSKETNHLYECDRCGHCTFCTIRFESQAA